MKRLTKIPNIDRAFEDFGMHEYSPEFWDKVRKQDKEASEQYEEEEKLLMPSNEYMRNRVFDI